MSEFRFGENSKKKKPGACRKRDPGGSRAIARESTNHPQTLRRLKWLALDAQQR
jgi:hypothetical protein